MIDNRQMKRIHVVAYVSVQERGNDDSVGRVIDLTTRGMRLCSKEQMDPGSVVKFRMNLPLDCREPEEISFEANIIWCRGATLPGYYDAGIELQKVSAPDVAMIEQFIQQTSFEQRCLSVAAPVSEEY